MKDDLKTIYRSAWQFALACPALFMIPVLIEMAQHIAEMHIGMYESLEAAKALESAPLRLQFGLAKVVALMLPSYWFVRYLAFGQSAREAKRLDPKALALWGFLTALGLAQSVNSLFGTPIVERLGWAGALGGHLGTAVDITAFVIGIYFTVWTIAWALGNARIGPIASARMMHGFFWRAVAYLVVGVVPLMAVHYGLGFAAMSAATPAWLDWPILTIDAVVVGFLCLTMYAGNVLVSKRTTLAKNLSLIPSPARNPAVPKYAM